MPYPLIPNRAQHETRYLWAARSFEVPGQNSLNLIFTISPKLDRPYRYWHLALTKAV
jgi:hypothetical protein